MEGFVLHPLFLGLILGLAEILAPGDKERLSCQQEFILIALLAIVCVLAFVVLCLLQNALKEARKAQNLMRETFSKEFKDKIPAASESFFHQWWILLVLIIAITIGTGLDIWMIQKI